MKKTKMEKGITLVALIITIVILLILAAVAISSIQNDGLIGKVNDAATKWNESVKKEQGILDDYLQFLESGSDIVLLKKYVLGEDSKGRDFYTEIYDGSEFIADDILPNASKEIEEISMLYGECVSEDVYYMEYYIKYNKNAYKITVLYDEENDISTTKDVKLVYVPQGREGTEVLYDSNGNGKPEKWTVITDRGGKLEIVYPDKVFTDVEGNGLVLGSASNIEVTTDLNGDGTLGDTIDKSIASYNNLITQINEFCKTTITATNNGGVRSIGASQEKDEPYYDLSSYNQAHIKLKQGDITDCDEDLAKLFYYNIASANDNYYIPSRNIEFSGSYIYFNYILISASGTTDTDYLLRLKTSTEEWRGRSPELGVRPVIINPQLTSIEDATVRLPLTCTDTDIVITEADNVQLGDVNQDGKLDISDLNYLISIVCGEIGELTSKQLIAADMDKDKKLTEEDIDLLTKVFKGELKVGIATGDASQIKYAERIDIET